MFGFSTVKLILLGIAAAAILSFVGLAFHWKHTMTARGQKLDIICTATRSAADNPKLDCDNVTTQIGELGAALKKTTDALNDQNAKVAALGAESVKQQTAASQAVLKAQGRSQKAEATAQRLAASSRSGEVQAKPCAPSKALQDAWQ